MRRVFLIVCDSLGVGAMPDAERFGDVGAHTLDHLVAAAGGLDVPRLVELGLGCVEGVTSVARSQRPAASFARLTERSPGKDTSTGHWEMMGCVLEEEFPVYAQGFPPEILDPIIARAGLEGVLCNAAASGTEVLEQLGAEHLESGKPIVYTSADSVLQVAAHEEAFGLERLYEVCRIAREVLDPYGVGRVIARPFVGEVGAFQRTYNRRDYSLDPPCESTLDRLMAAGVPTVGVGKIEDIYAGHGVSRSIHSEGNSDGMRVMNELARELEGGLAFINLVDFDMLYGHRRDAPGYARALEVFDAELRELERHLRPEDVVMITADHGNDPTHLETTDHTREYVPLLLWGGGLASGVDLGTRASFADVGATVEELFGLEPSGPGTSLVPALSARA